MAKPKTILIVDDEKSLAKVMGLKLTAEGYRVLIAYNGAEALEQLGQHSVDLILLDIIMPDVDGFTVLETLVSQGKKIPVIVTSNLSQPEDIEKAKALGAIDFCIKSSTPLNEIVQKVNDILKK